MLRSPLQRLTAVAVPLLLAGAALAQPALHGLPSLSGANLPNDSAPQASAEAWRRVPRGEALPTCLKAGRRAPVFVRESRVQGMRVDACGRRTNGAGEELPLGGMHLKVAASPLTIERMTTGYSGSHGAGGPIALIGPAVTYELSDGSQWTSGAGTFSLYSSQLDHVEVSGSTLRYVLVPPPAGSIYEQTDFDAGNHSAQGRLAPSGELVLEAQEGSATAVLHGNALIATNDATAFGDRFHYYDAVVGSVVPFEMTFTMSGGTWAADSFSQAFSYSISGFVDFAQPVSVPGLAALRISGPPQVPDDFAVPYAATARFDNGVERDVTPKASWLVDPGALASIAGGLLTVGTLGTPEAELTLSATFVHGGASLTATKVVRALAEVTAEKPGTWPMFQANARHTGFVAAAVQPTTFRLKWQRELEAGSALHPVAAGDGKVFVTRQAYVEEVPNVVALRAVDGSTLWSRSLGSVEVNPPSYAYGSVYLQTSTETINGLLRAFDGETGDPVFEAPHSRQSANYYAPTISDGKAYINGGFAGGMYGFEAYSGDDLWFVGLPQVDQWTPAVDAATAYAYVGGNAPGLYAQDRNTGAASYFVADPAFSGGTNMNLAPVLGEHADVIAINNGRLISFDTGAHTIRWQVAAQYAGQPSVAQDRIYAIDGGRLRVLDEVTHAEVWSWQAPDGNLAGPMIVTDGHVFASTGVSVHAVDLATHLSVWSYPVAGRLALADGTLYVASADGKLSAFAGPSAASLYTVTPCRVVDTRLTTGVPVGGPALAAGVPRTLPIAGNCGVPPTAVAVVLNVTITQPGAAGFLQLDGTGGAGVFSTLNYGVGATRANLSLSTLSPAGSLTAVASQAAGTTVHLLLDVTGYFQ